MGQVNCLGAQTLPDVSGNCVPFSMEFLGVGGNWKHSIYRFENNLRGDLWGAFPIPSDYPLSPITARILVRWTAEVTSGNVRWGFDYRAVGGDNVESLTQSGAQEVVIIADTAPSATTRRMEVAIGLTPANFAAGDTVQFDFYRDGGNAGDTLNDATYLVELLFDYA